MRTTLVEELLLCASKDKNIYLLTGDLGFSVFEPFIEKFPTQYINVGAAEQNMAGIAAGLALSGKTVLIYSIANFPTLRCLEQIRDDICYHQANVKIISVGCGYSYGLQGYTHFGVEDISILRTLPNLKILSPADAAETQLAFRYLINEKGPVYMRLGASKEKTLHEKPLADKNLSSMIPIIQNNDKTIILSVGTITSFLFEKIIENKLLCDLWSVPIVSPLDENKLANIIKSAEKVITVEEHQLAGGFGSLVMETLLKLKNNGMIKIFPEFHRIGVDNVPMDDIGNQDYLRNKINFSALFGNEKR